MKRRMYLAAIFIAILSVQFCAGVKNFSGREDEIPQEKLDNPRGLVFKSATFNASTIEPLPGAAEAVPGETTMAKKCETPHKYGNSETNFICTFTTPDNNERGISLHFSGFETESNYDFVYLYDEANTLVEMYHGKLGDFWSPTIRGKKVTLKFTSDVSVRKNGFAVDVFKYGAIEAAVTAAADTSGWKSIQVNYESKHGVTVLPLKNWQDSVTISQPGATALQLHFKKISIDELCFAAWNNGGCIAWVQVFDKNNTLVYELKKSNSNNKVTNYWMPVTINGDSVTVKYKIKTPLLGSAINEYGFFIDEINVQGLANPNPYASKYPLVLHHGFAGWDTVFGIDYFFRVKQHLVKKGYQVYVTEVAPFGSLQLRTDQLKSQIDSILASSGAAKVNIIAHSMGGLDSRLLTSDNTQCTTSGSSKDAVCGKGYAAKVASLTTIATPHLGTRVADVALGILPGKLDDALNTILGIASAAYNGNPPSNSDIMTIMYNLSEKFAVSFNQDHPLPVSLQNKIFTYAGISNPPLPLRSNSDEVNLLLYPTFKIIAADGNAAHRASDGMVPYFSAVWKSGYYQTYKNGDMHADHFDEIGQILGLTDKSFDHLDFYLTVANRISQAGD